MDAAAASAQPNAAPPNQAAFSSRAPSQSCSTAVCRAACARSTSPGTEAFGHLQFEPHALLAQGDLTFWA